ncbi:MAG: flavin reductase [Fidelibacterota bacterium]|nr:MAG: flavin reductase [Candidatus Neomarinimicrobiota bacterium]
MQPNEVHKQVLRRFTYGLYIVAAATESQYAAATVTWLSQVSFDPPLIMLALRNGSRILDMCQKAGACAVHVLAKGQEQIASSFFKPARVEKDALSGFRFHPGSETGAPIFSELPAWCEVKVTKAHPAGDHTLVVAEIVDAGVTHQEISPLALRDTPWHYGG